ncbi:DUF1643 domain-containing protein [Cupriavidus sp. TMH.W2]|uniref:DUF1643 domain-containing protein n=1 Tax=Cupriavidus sp. TMH.W2 TaxID=3434465 RepID=UPI003D7818E6
MEKGAVISDCKTFRYLLWRVWDPSRPTMGVLMVNPSTADAEQDDLTIDKVIKIARHNAYGGICVGNLAALRSTDPSALATAADPIGPDNDRHLQDLLGRAALILCAWGANANYLPGRVDAVKALMRAAGVQPWMLKLTQGGHPTHPLARGKGFIPVNTKLVPYVI